MRPLQLSGQSKRSCPRSLLRDRSVVAQRFTLRCSAQASVYVPLTRYKLWLLDLYLTWISLFGGPFILPSLTFTVYDV